jgi:hypothetical protein
MGKMPHITVINEAMRQNILPSVEDIKAGRVSVDDL